MWSLGPSRCVLVKVIKASFLAQPGFNIFASKDHHLYHHLQRAIWRGLAVRLLESCLSLHNARVSWAMPTSHEKNHGMNSHPRAHSEVDRIWFDSVDIYKNQELCEILTQIATFRDGASIPARLFFNRADGELGSYPIYSIVLLERDRWLNHFPDSCHSMSIMNTLGHWMSLVSMVIYHVQVFTNLNHFQMSSSECWSS